MDQRYCELIDERPDLFINHVGGINILLDEQDILNVEHQFNTRIGVQYEDEYVLFLKDAVKFPDGEVAPYIRMYHKNAGGVAILPICDKKILLLRHFRHSLRKWIWETPRGFCEKNSSNISNAQRELSEELGILDFEITELGTIVPDGGIVGEIISLYFAQLNSDSVFKFEKHEGINEHCLLCKEDILSKIKNGEINDGITISSIMLAITKGLI